MRAPYYSKQFERDVKRIKKRRKDVKKLKTILRLLVGDAALPEKYKDHPLSGDFSGYRECHIEPDWILIYKIEGQAVYFVRTGSHSDLFG